jgi:hypothetical protein
MNRCKSDLKPASKEHAYCVGFYTIPYIQVHIQSWHMANGRKKSYHVLDSTYMIGNGSEMSLIPIRVI